MGHTPGPWYWTTKRDGRYYLYTPKQGHCVVMDFVRKGMHGAQPRFSDRGDAPLGGIMHPADEIDLNENPDARLIAAAPDLLEACSKALLEMIKFGNQLNWPPEMPAGYAEACNKLRAAIARAEGKEHK